MPLDPMARLRAELNQRSGRPANLKGEGSGLRSDHDEFGGFGGKMLPPRSEEGEDAPGFSGPVRMRQSGVSAENPDGFGLSSGFLPPRSEEDEDALTAPVRLGPPARLRRWPRPDETPE